MFKYLISIILCCVLFSSEGFGQQEINDTFLFNETALLKHLESLSSDAFEGRRTGTAGAVKAQNYIINQFHVLHVLPFVEDYKQPFSFYKNKQVYKAVNVLGFVKGTKYSKKYIVISAHYDHEGIKKGKIYNGADDNASGVSALFSFAEYFEKNPPKHSVVLAAFDGEELGLQGSKFFINSNVSAFKTINCNLNMDMVSRSDKNQLYAVGTAYNETLKNIVSTYEGSENVKLIAGHDGYDGLENWTYSSDHVNFYKKDIPFLYFGVEDHEDYHEPTDDYENIHPEFYINAVKTIISVFEKVDDVNWK
jgi:Zn-dependent M28 family amino/carboxypeptidase